MRPRPRLVFAVLEDRAKRRVDRGFVEPNASQRCERFGPVDGFGDGRHFLELHPAQHTDDAHQFLGEVRGQLGDSGQ